MGSPERAPARFRSTMRSPHVLVLVLGLLVACVSTISLVTGARLAERNAPLATAVAELKFEAGAGFFRFEEIISRDDEDIGVAWKHLEQSAWYARAMLDGGEDSQGVYIPLRDTRLRGEVEELLAKITDLQKAATAAWIGREQPYGGSVIEQRLDAALEAILQQADGVATTLRSAIESDLRLFRILHLLLISICALLTALTGVLLFRHERRRARDVAALQESEERYRAIVEETSVLVCRFLPDGKITFVNEAYCRYFDTTSEALVGQPLQQFIPEADREAVMDHITNATVASPTRTHEHRVVTPNGETRWQRWTNRGLFDSRGRATSYLAMGEDITERKHAELALRASEERFRALFEDAPLGYQSLSAQGDFIEVNETWCKLLGYSREDVLGRNFSEFLHPDSRRHFEERFPTFKMLGHVLGVEFEMIRKDGTEITVSFDGRIGYEKDGSFKQTHCVLHDLTARKRAEEQAARFNRVLEGSLNEIYIFDAETLRFVRVNRGARENLGYSIEELQQLTPLDLKPGFTAESWAALLEPLRSGEQEKTQFTAVHRRKDGTQYPVEVHLQLMTEGRPVFVAIILDITERRRVEEQLRHAQKMEAVGQLAGGVAHDFNNLLQAINGYAELAQGDLDSHHPASSSIEEVAKAGVRASTLVRQLLAFSRRQVLDMKDVNLNDVLADLMKMIRRVIGEHIALTVVPADVDAIVRADPGQVEQVLMNLCVNARDAMPQGGTITIKTETIRIGTTFCGSNPWARPGHFVRLSVTDTGCGMDDNILADIFEPFFTTKGVGEGTGLGLSTVYGIIQQHDGMIKVFSKVDSGTTFEVYLPLAARSAAPAAVETDGMVLGGTETILLAEDDGTVLKLASTILERAGYTVLAAVDGVEALRMFDEHAEAIDLVLLDVVMPRLGGHAVRDRIRRNGTDVRFLFASGYSLSAVHTDVILDQGVRLIQKPYRRDTLLRGVRAALDA